MRIKKYVDGGVVDEAATEQIDTKGGAGMDVISGAVQGLYGAMQLKKAQGELMAAKASAPSLDTPSQYYENYRNAYDSELARLESDAIQQNLATSISTLQGAGGRALVGGLSAATNQAQNAQNRMLAQERQMRLNAGQALASAESKSQQLKYKENVRQQEQAQAAINAAGQNIAKGATQLATGVMFGGIPQIGQQIAKGAKSVAGVAKKGYDFAKDVPSKISALQAKMEIKKTRNAIGYNDVNANMQDFVLKQQQYMQEVGKSWTDKDINDRLNQTISDMRPPVSVVEDTWMPRQIALQEAQTKQFEQDQRSKVAAVQDATANIGPSQKQMDLIANQIQNTPTLNNTTDEYIVTDAGVMKNPMYNMPIDSTNMFGIKSIEGTYKHGGMMTGGKFSHTSNPIDIVQNGKKIGEATGGEYILNPTQAKAIAQESPYAKKLFAKFMKEAKKK